jgi:hypothetical protein
MGDKTKEELINKARRLARIHREGLVTLSKNRLFSAVARRGQVLGIAQSGKIRRKH